MNEKKVKKIVGRGLILGAAVSAVVFAWVGLSELQGVAEMFLTGAEVNNQVKNAASCFGLAALCGWLAVPGWLIATDTSA